MLRNEVFCASRQADGPVLKRKSSRFAKATTLVSDSHAVWMVDETAIRWTIGMFAGQSGRGQKVPGEPAVGGAAVARRPELDLRLVVEVAAAGGVEAGGMHEGDFAVLEETRAGRSPPDADRTDCRAIVPRASAALAPLAGIFSTGRAVS